MTITYKQKGSFIVQGLTFPSGVAIDAVPAAIAKEIKDNYASMFDIIEKEVKPSAPASIEDEVKPSNKKPR